MYLRQALQWDRRRRAAPKPDTAVQWLPEPEPPAASRPATPGSHARAPPVAISPLLTRGMQSSCPLLSLPPQVKWHLAVTQQRGCAPNRNCMCHLLWSLRYGCDQPSGVRAEALRVL